MTIPREKPSAAGAPVLFRLPHLHPEVSVSQSSAAVSQQVATNPRSGSNDCLDQSERPAPNFANERSGFKPAADRPSDDATSQSDTSFLSGWSITSKRSVVVLAVGLLVYGAWMLGQRSAPLRPESVAVDQLSPVIEQPAVASQPVADGANNVVRVAQGSGDGAGRPANRPTGFVPVTEPADSFYVPEEMPSVEASELPGGLISEPVENQTTSSDVLPAAGPSLDSLEPPANLSVDNVLADPTAAVNADQAAAAQKPPLGDSAAIPAQDGNQSDANAAVADSNFATSLTPGLPGFDTAAVDKLQQPLEAVPAAIKSSMPNAIVDWYRYLPGGTGAVRAASSTSSIGTLGGQQPQVGNQAFYVDENETPALTNGAAPFYR